MTSTGFYIYVHDADRGPTREAWRVEPTHAVFEIVCAQHAMFWILRNIGYYHALRFSRQSSGSVTATNPARTARALEASRRTTLRQRYRPQVAAAGVRLLVCTARRAML